MPIALLLMTALGSAEPDRAGQSAAAAMADCLDIRRDKARLACFDRAAGALRDRVAGRSEGQPKPIGMGASTVARRAEGRVARKEPARIETVATDARPLANDRWRITLEDGAVWRTTEPVIRLEPRAGQRVVITRSPIGSYFLSIDGTMAVRGVREK